MSRHNQDYLFQDHLPSRYTGRRLLENSPPVINPQIFQVNENAPNGVVVGTVVASDPVGQSLTFAITGGNDLGHFVIDPTNGQLTVLGPLNYEVKKHYDLTVQVTDTVPPAPLFNLAAKFCPGLVSSLQPSLHSIAVGDMDGDSNLDVMIVGSLTSSNNKIIPGLGDGAGSFAVGPGPIVGNGKNDHSYSIALGDLNGDADLDVVTVHYNSGIASILLGDGTVNFRTAATQFSVGSFPTFVALGDLNGDGKLDLTVANRASTVSILLGDGAGNFGAATDFSAGDNLYSLALGDLNGDGKLDIAAPDYASGKVSVLLGDGTGSFSAATRFPVGIAPHSVAVNHHPY